MWLLQTLRNFLGVRSEDKLKWGKRKDKFLIWIRWENNLFRWLLWERWWFDARDQVRRLLKGLSRLNRRHNSCNILMKRNPRAKRWRTSLKIKDNWFIIENWTILKENQKDQKLADLPHPNLKKCKSITHQIKSQYLTRFHQTLQIWKFTHLFTRKTTSSKTP